MGQSILERNREAIPKAFLGHFLERHSEFKPDHYYSELRIYKPGYLRIDFDITKSGWFTTTGIQITVTTGYGGIRKYIRKKWRQLEDADPEKILDSLEGKYQEILAIVTRKAKRKAEADVIKAQDSKDLVRDFREFLLKRRKYDFQSIPEDRVGTTIRMGLKGDIDVEIRRTASKVCKGPGYNAEIKFTARGSADYIKKIIDALGEVTHVE